MRRILTRANSELQPLGRVAEQDFRPFYIIYRAAHYFLHYFELTNEKPGIFNHIDFSFYFSMFRKRPGAIYSSPYYLYWFPSIRWLRWLLQIKDKQYSPIELPEAFQIDGSEALVRFKPLDEYFCGWWGGERYQRIEIFDIKKK